MLAKLYSSEAPIQTLLVSTYFHINIWASVDAWIKSLLYIFHESISWMREIVIPVSTKWHRLLSFKWSWTYFEQVMCFYIVSFFALTSLLNRRGKKNAIVYKICIFAIFPKIYMNRVLFRHMVDSMLFTALLWKPPAIVKIQQTEKKKR